MSIDYTLWPNADGQLGQNKVAIPDGVTVQWPEGDALVGNFVYKDGLLSGFVDTKALVVNESKVTTFPYDYVNIHLDSIQEGSMSVTRGERTKYFTVTYSGNSGDTIMFKYKGCKTVGDVKSVDIDFWTNDIVNGAWTESLADLENGSSMFYDCYNLTAFNSDLPSLTNGSQMFRNCYKLINFNNNLSSLIFGGAMFNECTGLSTFNSDLSSLTHGLMMFFGCNNLTTFNSNLCSLTNGYDMFKDCILDTESIMCIAESINDVRDLTNGINVVEGIYKTINIGIDNSIPNEQESEAFNNIAAKGWTVLVNGKTYTSTASASPASVMTLDETGEEISTPIPYYAKPIQCDEEHAQYIDSEGNFFIILGGQFIYVDDPETYGMFINEEDAAANMGLSPLY